MLDIGNDLRRRYADDSTDPKEHVYGGRLAVALKLTDVLARDVSLGSKLLLGQTGTAPGAS